MSKEYLLIPSKVFLRDMKKIPKGMKLKIKKALLDLKKDPYVGRNIKKLTSMGVGNWRLRVGDFRIRYDIVGREIRLHIVRPRKDVYRKK